MCAQHKDSRRGSSRWIPGAVMAASICLPGMVTATGSGNSPKNLTGFGLTDGGYLVRFSTSDPATTKQIGPIGFVVPLIFPPSEDQDTSLIGIDFRVQDGKLYGVGNRGGIYTINTRNAQTTFVSALTVPLSGKFFGVDFNPAADALRVVSNNGQNLRHPFSGATMFVTQQDGTLTYPATSTTPDTIAKGVTGSAYTNNDFEAPTFDENTSTTLFGLDTNLDQIVVQSPANAGVLAATGKLGVNAGRVAGFDIFSKLRHGVTVDVQGFATLLVNGGYSFYQVNLLTGKADLLGRFREAVVDIAIPTTRPPVIPFISDALQPR